MATKSKIEYPSNVMAQGTLAFPIKSVDEIEALKQWRLDKNIKKPKYDDKIGGNLLIKEKTLERVANYLETDYLPFVDTLYKETDGEKGIEPDEVAELLALVKARDWSAKNLPIRELSAKDIENNGGDDNPFVAKIRFAGPYQGKGRKDLEVKYIVLDEHNKQQVVKANELQDYGVELPSGSDDDSKLWFGSGWPFRLSLRMNAYNTANAGVTAYANEMYLLSWLDLPTFSGNNDEAVIADDGDDWSDE